MSCEMLVCVCVLCGALRVCVRVCVCECVCVHTQSACTCKYTLCELCGYITALIRIQ